MGATLKIIYAGEEREYKIPAGEPFYIGRGDNSLSMRINHASISRVHTRLEKKEETWFVTDMGSRNGTYVNGDQISGETALQSGDQLRIGKLKVVFETNAAPPYSVDDSDSMTVVEEEDWSADKSDGFKTTPDSETAVMTGRRLVSEDDGDEDTPVNEVEAEFVDPFLGDNKENDQNAEDDFGDLDEGDTPPADDEFEENMVTVDGLSSSSEEPPRSDETGSRRGLVLLIGVVALLAIAGAGTAGYMFFFKESVPASDTGEMNAELTGEETQMDAGDSEVDGNVESTEEPTDSNADESDDSEAAPADDPGADTSNESAEESAPAEVPGVPTGGDLDSEVRGEVPDL